MLADSQSLGNELVDKDWVKITCKIGARHQHYTSAVTIEVLQGAFPNHVNATFRHFEWKDEWICLLELLRRVTR